MGALSLLHYQFRIDYPYYGLFRSADVKIIEAEGDVLYQCEMINGTEVWLKKAKSQRWLDMESGSETPLARLLGVYIDDYIGKSK
jgi:hypothetical protein